MNEQMNSALAQGDQTPVVLKGTQEFMNKQIPVVLGGFGEGQKVVLVKTIAEIHGMEIKHVNELINRNIKRFKDKIDILDLGVVLNDTELKEFGFTQQALNSYKGLRAKGKGGNIYLLSERGYAKLIKIMDTDLAWEIHDKLIDEYFHLREAVKNIRTQTQPKVATKEKEIEARLINAKVREASVYLKIADRVNVPTYQQICYSKATEALNGEALLPLPKAERKTYSAGEIGERLGITANKVGALANKHKLKTREYGLMVWDKSKYSNKQVETWRYYDNVIPILKEILNRDGE